MASLWLLSAIVAIAATASGSVSDGSPVLVVPALLLVVLAISGIYMLASPWLRKFRSR